jgi:hypothetical protein
MAKVQTEIIVVKLSKLVKDTDDDVSQLVNNDIESSLEAIVQELVGDQILVEIERGN